MCMFFLANASHSRSCACVCVWVCNFLHAKAGQLCRSGVESVLKAIDVLKSAPCLESEGISPDNVSVWVMFWGQVLFRLTNLAPMASRWLLPFPFLGRCLATKCHYHQGPWRPPCPLDRPQSRIWGLHSASNKSGLHFPIFLHWQPGRPITLACSVTWALTVMRTMDGYHLRSVSIWSLLVVSAVAIRPVDFCNLLFVRAIGSLYFCWKFGSLLYQQDRFTAFWGLCHVYKRMYGILMHFGDACGFDCR